MEGCHSDGGSHRAQMRASGTDWSPPGQLLKELNMGCANEEERARKSGVGGRWLRGIVPQGRGEAAGGGEDRSGGIRESLVRPPSSGPQPVTPSDMVGSNGEILSP